MSESAFAGARLRGGIPRWDSENAGVLQTRGRTAGPVNVADKGSD